MDYNDLNTALTGLLVIPVLDPQWISILPSVIDYAEGRIYKNMDFLAVSSTDTSKVFTPANRQIILPTRLAVPEQLGFADLTGSVNFLDPVSLEFINSVWPEQATPGDMKWWCLNGFDNAANAYTAVVAGTPAAAYVAHVHGKFRPEPISAANTSTYLSVNHPELLVAACMIFASGYQRDFGAQASDPGMSQSWENQYKALLEASMIQEQRVKSQGPGWQHLDPAPQAGTQRT